MRARFLLLAPILVLIAGCSEEIDAQQNISEANKTGMPPEQEDETANASAEQETDLDLHSPVGLD